MTRRSRFKQKLLDGRYRWGLLSQRTGRYGAESIRVLIYPPDTTEIDRRLARLTRLWPGISIVLIIIKAPALAALTEFSLLIAAVSALLFLVVIGAALTRMSAPVVNKSVKLFASVSFLSPKKADRDRYDYAAQLAGSLQEAEWYLDHGHISWNRYRALWEESYWNSHRRCR